jgi:adenosylcobinamide-phosphate synthase
MLETLPWVMGVALWIALAIDHWLGEPAARWHPVVWIGHYLNWAANKFVPENISMSQPKLHFWLGAFYWIVGAAFVCATALIVQYWISYLHVAFAVLLLGLVLKPMLALAMLCSEALAVESALGESLEAGRNRLAWLVSRDTQHLTADEVREAALASLAENLNDSFVAPVFWFVLLGLPGAALYRFANTADAMWGYPSDRCENYWQWAGKWAARADDVLSWLPARLTALVILIVSRSGSSVWGQVWLQASKTPSPNSGWPMAAMACALNLRLGKTGVYVLNSAGRTPTAGDMLKAVNNAKNTAVVLVFIAQAAIYLIAK